MSVYSDETCLMPINLPNTLFTTSKGIVKSDSCHRLLQGAQLAFYLSPSESYIKNIVSGNIGFVGWGKKENTQKIERLSRVTNKPFYRLEDGFISYLTHPSQGGERFSMIVDDLGIYYDATSPSRLEVMLNEADVSDNLLERARHLQADIQHHFFSKYNHSALPSKSQLSHIFKPSHLKSRVLVVDQTRNDCSIKYGMATSDSFITMMNSAIDENPAAEIYVKLHPDIRFGKKTGYLDNIVENDRVHVISDNINPLALIEKVDKVYTVTSQLGFEALILGKSVVCFGVPFYAGWGLTDDRQPCARRTRQRNLLEVLALAYLAYPRYIHPYTKQLCEFEDLRDLLIQKQKLSSEKVNTLYCIGFSMWKRAFVGEFVKEDVARVCFVRTLNTAIKKLKDGDGLLVWARKKDGELENAIDSGQLNPKIPIWRMEDGFIRSVGLGVDLRRPSSLVIDKQGIYFDYHQPSDLEAILNSFEFTASDLAAASKLHQQLLSKRVTKYNVEDDDTENLLSNLPTDRTLILVPGQVAGDASIKFGCDEINSNTKLLNQVQKNNPNAYIIYKPHPDVLSGNRGGELDYSFASDYHGRIISGGDIFECIDRCDEVHTLTSLTGFEALLQGKKVVTYGAPFYAGWGLTKDHIEVARRQRKLSIDMLIAGALMLYPKYIDWDSRKLSSAEVITDLLFTQREKSNQNADLIKVNWIERNRKKLSYLLETIIHK
jgi:capsular polysaccharide export protein